MYMRQSVLTLIVALAIAALLGGCGGGGTGPGVPPGTGGSGQPLVTGNITATPVAGDSLKDMVMNGGPGSMAFVVWGGQIEDFRLGMIGTTFGHIIYSTGSATNHDLAVVDIVTGVTRTIVDSPYDEVEPTWIEDGNRIAYQLTSGADTDVYTAAFDGRGPRSLTNYGPGPKNFEGEPAGVHSNDEILYTANQDGDTEIYRSETDGGSTMKLTNNADWDRHPAWSPNTSRVVYSSHIGGNWDLRIMRRDGTGDYPITSTSVPEDEPAWSPDGTRIAYSKRLAGNWDIYVCDVDGSGERRLTTNAAEDEHPSWSPDGQQIAFSSKRSGNGDIYVMNADGTGETRIVSNTDEDMDPEWNPAAKFARTFVGPAGSDGGEDPPFGSTPLDLAIVSGDEAGVIFFGLRCLGAASAIEVQNLNEEDLYPALLGVSIHTPDTITLLGQDQGRGKGIVRHIRSTGANATFVGDFDNVMIIFDPDQGRVMAIAPWKGAPRTMLPLDVTSVATAEPSLEVVGGQIVIRGPALGAPGGGVCQELVFDAGTGELVRCG